MGFLYVRKPVLENLEPPFLDLHAATWVGKDRFEIRPDARRFENWETNYAAKIGLGVAVDYALEWGMENIWERVQYLAGKLRQGLQNIPGVDVRDLGKVRCGIVSFTVKGHDPQEIMEKLAKKGINVTTTSILGTRLDMERRNLQLMVRASVHYYNTEHEIEHFLKALTMAIAI